MELEQVGESCDVMLKEECFTYYPLNILRERLTGPLFTCDDYVQLYLTQARSHVLLEGTFTLACFS